MGDLFAMLGIALLLVGFLTWLFYRYADAVMLLYLGFLCALLGIYYLMKSEAEKAAAGT